MKDVNADLYEAIINMEKKIDILGQAITDVYIHFDKKFRIGELPYEEDFLLSMLGKTLNARGDQGTSMLSDVDEKINNVNANLYKTIINIAKRIDIRRQAIIDLCVYFGRKLQRDELTEEEDVLLRMLASALSS